MAQCLCNVCMLKVMVWEASAVVDMGRDAGICVHSYSQNTMSAPGVQGPFICLWILVSSATCHAVLVGTSRQHAPLN